MACSGTALLFTYLTQESTTGDKNVFCLPAAAVTYDMLRCIFPNLTGLHSHVLIMNGRCNDSGRPIFFPRQRFDPAGKTDRRFLPTSLITCKTN
jgi:hypothetical protein